jgi:hypothetical protein
MFARCFKSRALAKLAAGTLAEADRSPGFRLSHCAYQRRGAERFPLSRNRSLAAGAVAELSPYPAATFTHQRPHPRALGILFSVVGTIGTRKSRNEEKAHSEKFQILAYLRPLDPQPRLITVCVENLVRIDPMGESLNVGLYGRAALFLPDAVGLAVQVEEPT